MTCACLSRQKKKSSRAVLPLQTNLPPPHETQVNPSLGATLEPHSPFLKLGRLTLLARIERAFNHSLAEEKVKELISYIPASEFVRLTISSYTGAPALEVSRNCPGPASHRTSLHLLTIASFQIEFPLPLQPESIVGRLMDSLSTDGIDSPAEIKGNQLPKHPNSAGLIRQSSGPRPKKLFVTPCKLHTQTNRHQSSG